MCFRPTEVSAPQICPQCGKKLQVLDGLMQKICPFCRAPMANGLSVGHPEKLAAPSAPGTSNAVVVPRLPITPDHLKSVKIPAAPKPPENPH